MSDLPDFKNDWWQQAFVAQLPTGVALAPINWGLVVNDLTEALQKVIYKKSSPEETAKDFTTRSSSGRRITSFSFSASLTIIASPL